MFGNDPTDKLHESFLTAMEVFSVKVEATSLLSDS